MFAGLAMLGTTSASIGQQQGVDPIAVVEDAPPAAPHRGQDGDIAVPSLDAQSKSFFTFTPFAWLVSLDGDATVRGSSSDVDAGFWDTITGSDTVFGLMGQVIGGTEEWSLFLTTTYARVGVDGISGSLGAFDTSTDTTADLGWFELGGAVPLIKSRSASAEAAGGSSFRLDAYAGARITLIDLELDVDLSLSGTPVASRRDDGNQVWVEPFIGLEGRYGISDDVLLQIGGDIGGFGAGSDFAWQTMASVGFEFELFGLPSTGFIGYRALGQDYQSGDFAWDVVAHGPILGIEIRF
jgi:hypothetical protein